MPDIIQETPTVLCIENEASIRRFMERLLRRKFGAVVEFVSSGEEAIQTLEKRTDWVLVISDWNIDGNMDGGSVLLWVMDRAPHLLSKYVFLSSSEWAEKAAAGTGIPFLKKPAGTEDICSTLSPFLQAQP